MRQWEFTGKWKKIDVHGKLGKKNDFVHGKMGKKRFCSWENGENLDFVHGKIENSWRKTMGNGPVAHGQVTPCTINLSWPIRVGIYMLTVYIYIYTYIYISIYMYIYIIHICIYIHI